MKKIFSGNNGYFIFGFQCTVHNEVEANPSQDSRSLVTERQSVFVSESSLRLRFLVGDVHYLDGVLQAGVPVDAAPNH